MRGTEGVAARLTYSAVLAAWLCSAPAGAAAFDAGQLDAMLRQDGFAPEHPSDNLWTVSFPAGSLGRFPLCLALSADKSALVTYVRVDQTGIDHTPDLTRTVRDLNRSLGRTAVGFDPQGGLIVHEQVPMDDLTQASLQRAIRSTGWGTVAVFTKIQPALQSSEIKCSPYLGP